MSSSHTSLKIRLTAWLTALMVLALGWSSPALANPEDCTFTPNTTSWQNKYNYYYRLQADNTWLNIPTAKIQIQSSSGSFFASGSFQIKVNGTPVTVYRDEDIRYPVSDDAKKVHYSSGDGNQTLWIYTNFTSDADIQVVHSESGNNWNINWTMNASCPVSPPDLVVEDFTSFSTTWTTGNSYVLRATTRNIGGSSSNSSRLRWYISSNSTISPSDTPLDDTDYVSGLQPGAADIDSDTVTAPSGTGTRYVGACVDAVSGETNTHYSSNCSNGVRITLVEPTEPDLVVQNPGTNSTTWIVGNRYSINATTANIGTGASPSSTLRWYISTNSTISPSDTAFSATDTVSALSAGGSEYDIDNVTAPSGLGSGTRYVGACVDAVSGESDTSTSSNCSSGVQITLQEANSAPSRPTAVTVPATVTQNQPVTLSFNRGSDNDGNQVRLRCEGTHSNHPPSNQYVSSYGTAGSQVSFDITFNTTGSNSIACRSEDNASSQQTSAWEIVPITVQAANSAPTAPVPVSVPSTTTVGFATTVSLQRGSDTDSVRLRCHADNSGYLNGSPYYSDYGTAGSTVTFDIPFYTEGTHTLTCISQDNGSPQLSSSAYVTQITASNPNTAPVFQSGSVSPDTLVGGSSTTFKTTWSDAEGNYIVNVQARYRRGNENWQYLTLDYVDGSQPPRFSKTQTITAGPGIYDVQFRASDADDQFNVLHTTGFSSGGQFQVLEQPVSNHKPVLGIVQAPNNATPGEPYTITLRASDEDLNLNTIEVDWTGNGNRDGAVRSYTVAAHQDLTVSHTYTGTTALTWTATAYDTQGLASTTVRKGITVGHASTGNQLSGLDGRDGIKQSGLAEKSRKACPNGDCSTPSSHSSATANSCGAFVGDPVDTATGAQVMHHDLLTVQGVLPITFSLFYNSTTLQNDLTGRGWGMDLGHKAYLLPLENGDLEVHWSANASNTFTHNGDGTYNSSDTACRLDRIVEHDDGSYTLTRKDRTVFQFNAEGLLTARGNEKGQVIQYTRDDQGRLSNISEPVSNVFLSYHYNEIGLLDSVTDPLGRRVSLIYDANKDLVEIVNAAGESIHYTYNQFGQALTGVNNDGEVMFSNVYDASGRVVQQDDARSDNLVMSLSYDETTQPGYVITTITDRLGNQQAYSFDSDYQMVAMEDALGQLYQYQYNANGQRIAATDPLGRVTQFVYDADGNLTSTTDAEGRYTAFTYDAHRNLTSVEDAEHNVTLFSYDAANNRIQITDATAYSANFTYNAQGQILTRTTPPGQTTRYTYSNGRVHTVTDPENNTSTLGYDAAGRMTTVTDADGYTTAFSYDNLDRVTAITDALGHQVSFTYNARGKVTRRTDARGNATLYGYDANGNRTQVTDPLGNSSFYRHDNEDRLIEIIDARGHSTLFSYDAKGRRTQVTDAAGQIHTIQYDAGDRVIGTTDALGNQTQFDLDLVDNITRITPPNGHVTNHVFDALDRLTQTTDGLGHSTQFSYDALGRLAETVDALGGSSTRSWDPDGHPSSLIDPNNNHTGFAVDGNGNTTSEFTDDGSQTGYQFNARSLLNQVNNGRGHARTISYDDAGRPVQISDADGTISYSYDANSNLLTVTENGITISREYDALDRVIRYSDGTYSLEYAYDANGNLTELTYPDGRKVSYAYDAADRLISVTDWAGRTTSYAYDQNNRLIRTDRPNGSAETRSYDSAGLPTQIRDTHNGEILVQYDFEYDLAGNLTRETINPTPQSLSLRSATMSYGAANRLDSFQGAQAVFDNDGNMVRGPLQDSFAEFEYDTRNRLIRAGNTYYSYDAENHRKGIQGPEGITEYLINPEAELSQILEEHRPNGETVYYVYGLGLIGEESPAGYHSYHFDLRGSTTALTDINGDVVNRYQYGPYGELAYQEGNKTTGFLYNGRDGVVTDATGLYYMRARYYSPEMHRFLNRDILLGHINLSTSLNRYSFNSGNPVLLIDPSGNFSLFIGVEYLPSPPKNKTFFGKEIAMKYIELYGDKAWSEIRNDRDSTKKIQPGSAEEAMRNAEHFLYARQQVMKHPNSYGLPGAMEALVLGYSTLKVFQNTLEKLTMGLYDSPKTYSPPTIDEIKAGLQGTNANTLEQCNDVYGQILH